MTNTINFEAPQAKVENGENGIQLSQVVLPYSIRSSVDSGQYLGGQMTLNANDGIKLSDNTDAWTALALAKVKAMVANTEIYVAPVQVEAPEEESSEAPATPSESVPATSVAPVSSASPASSVATEAPVSSAEAQVASVAPDTVANPDSTQETTTPSESTTEA